MMQSGAELELSTALEPANASFCTAGFPRQKEISRSRIFAYRQFHPETVEFAPRPKSTEVASASRQ